MLRRFLIALSLAAIVFVLVGTLGHDLTAQSTFPPSLPTGCTNGQVPVYNTTTKRWACGTGGGSPGGSTTQVQRNNAGAFGGITGATSDGTTMTLTSPTILTGATLTAGTATTAVSPFTLTQTLNNAGVTFPGVVFNFTNTASNSASRLFDVQIAGTSKLFVDANSTTVLSGTLYAGNGNSGSGGISTSGIIANSTIPIGFAASNLLSPDVTLRRGAADTLELYRSTNAQTFNIYAGFTSSTNYSTRLRVAPTAGNVGLTAESAGATASANIDIALAPKGTGVVTTAADYKGRHFLGTGTAPAVSNTSANSCGTTAATLAGTDTAGTITVGATSGTSCTVTFTAAYGNAPSCWATNQTTPAALPVVTTTTTAVVSGTFGGGDTLRYGCVGF